MTEITIEREKRFIYLNGVLGLCLMFVGIFLILKMLTWAVDLRISSVETIEANKITTAVREKQLSCLARNIYHEAGAEPFEGKVAVAQVTINRANSDGKFPGDICKVVFQKNMFYDKVLCQFSWVCDRPGNLKPKHPDVYEESMEVAKKVLLEGFRLPSLTDALYFHADYINPRWKRERVAKIGRHVFYK
ncbi:MAG: cell wall hydrolase [Synechococcaceae bacterium WB8_1B_057]|nr:cell wall hydrolase [Synechococcaceae bacterium WB6_1A_059]NDG79406.1 cell wall hydrolase [Synechococcaceae bacterium WB8_1B_057]